MLSVWLRSICNNTDFNKCGQTSRPDVGTTIQTGGNFEESLGSCCFSLDLSYLNFRHIIFQGGCRCDRYFHRCDIVHHNLTDLLLLLNIFHTWSTTSSSGIPCPPRRSKRRKDWNQYSKIQENGVQCITGANNISAFLSANRINSSCCCYYWTGYTISLPRGVRNIFSRSVKVRQAAKDTIRGRLEDSGVRGSITFRKFPIGEKKLPFGRGNFSFFQVLVFNIA